MPIYAYRCAACGHTKEVLRKLSDAPLTDCPSCGVARFEKQVTAAGFQLKGSGWYVTDFRNPAAAPSAAKPDADKPLADKPGDAATPAATASASPAPGSAAGPAKTPATTPAAAPASTPRPSGDAT